MVKKKKTLVKPKDMKMRENICKICMSHKKSFNLEFTKNSKNKGGTNNSTEKLTKNINRQFTKNDIKLKLCQDTISPPSDCQNFKSIPIYSAYEPVGKQALPYTAGGNIK